MQMVKGISRQVIMVHSPDKHLFEQAIFILKDDVQDVTDDMLLKEAKRIINLPKRKMRLPGPIWACGGAALTGMIWLFSIIL